jgi:serine/threonine protein kinase
MFGFKLGSQDFYLESQSELDDCVSHFREFCILDTFDDDFVVIKELGRGSSSTVYLIEDLQTRKPFACKTFSKALLTLKQSSISNLFQEIEIHTRLSHPSISKLYSVYESDSSISLILEYLPHGDLYKRVLSKKHFHDSDVSKFARNLLEVLEYLHSKNIVHRDLKLENIMMTSDDDFSIKLIDFGLAYSSPLPQSQRCGSPGYIAPEVLTRSEYDHRIDLFSAGVVLFIVSSGVHPFCASTPGKVLNVNANCQVTSWKVLKGLGKSLVMIMMAKEPEDRLSASELLSHPFICPSKRSSFSVNLMSTLTGSLRMDS